MERLRLWLGHNDPSLQAAADGREPFPTLSPALLPPLLDELRNIQTMASLRPADRVLILLGALFTDALVERKEIRMHSKYLSALSTSTIQQRHLIAAFEWLCGTKYPAKARYFAVVLKDLLEEELVEEDVFLEWAADLTRNEYSAQTMVCLDTLEVLKGAAAPFVTWLQEAEEEGESGEEDEDEDEEEEGAGWLASKSAFSMSAFTPGSGKSLKDFSKKREALAYSPFAMNDLARSRQFSASPWFATLPSIVYQVPARWTFYTAGPGKRGALV
mmetsp:Transcript_11947/g.26875  ORF Transcript_11947/g.26875 Transcript_11947/m.26875 type:complete len:273 (-) Transcript_11947:28-846(-)